MFFPPNTSLILLTPNCPSRPWSPGHLSSETEGPPSRQPCPGQVPLRRPCGGPLSGSPNDQEFVEQIRSCGQQSSPGQVKCFLPPGIGAQPCHDPTVILQRESDDVPIKGEGLLGPGPPAEEGDALVPAQIHHARPGRGKANPPVHAARLAAGAPPRARAARMGRGRRGRARAQLRAAGAGGDLGGGCRGGGGVESAPAAPGGPDRRHPRAQGGRRVPPRRPLRGSLCVGAWRRPRDVMAPRGRETGGRKSPTPRPAPAPHLRGPAASAPARPAPRRHGLQRLRALGRAAGAAPNAAPPGGSCSPSPDLGPPQPAARLPPRPRARGWGAPGAHLAARSGNAARHPVGLGTAARSRPGVGWLWRAVCLHRW